MSNMPTSLSNGRYQLGKLLGRGGMAEVRVALDTRLGRTVAVKIMRSELANDEIFLSRFRREAHAVAQMNNPNIVNIHDSGEENIVDEHGHTERVPYLVMEYVQGQTLRNIIKSTGALSPQDAGQVIIGVLNALDYSHRCGVVHRDIKPGNIMISEQGVVKVMDFGIARALDDSAATMTQSQGVVGTAQYLSPEQARGETVDLRSDIYSAGCVLYEMLTGKPPFTGDSAVAVAYQHVSEVATPPSIIMPGLPQSWDQVCAKAMAKDRQNRYATAAEFRSDIYAMINGSVPSAAGFNPLADLASIKAQNRYDSVRAAATSAMPMPTQALPATQVYNSPQELAQRQSPATTNSYPNAFSPFDDDERQQSRVAMRAQESASRRRKRAIITSIIASIVVIAIAVSTWWFFVIRKPQPTLIEVPTLSSSVTRDAAEEKITAAGLRIQFRDDKTSDQPEGTFTKQQPQGGMRVKPDSVVTVWFSTGPQSIKIPDVKGDTQDEARETLKLAGFKVAASTQTEDSPDVEKDHVTRTDPASGNEANRGSTVLLYISSGRISVPDKLVGQPKDQVLKQLHDQQFNTNEVEENSDSIAAGSVTRTDPASGSSVAQRSTITIYVSKGKPQVTVSRDITLGETTLAEAIKTLSNQGFVVKTQQSNAKKTDIVVDMNPQPGEQATKGSTITVVTRPAYSNTDSDQSDMAPTKPPVKPTESK